jgi:hypothetical protein
MADDKDFSEWMGVVLDVFNDRPDKTYLVVVVGVDYERNGPDEPPALITQSMDGKGLMGRLDVRVAPQAVPPKKLRPEFRQ